MAYFGTGEGREKASRVGEGVTYPPSGWCFILVVLARQEWTLAEQLQTKKYFHGRGVDIFGNNQLSFAFKTLFDFLC